MKRISHLATAAASTVGALVIGIGLAAPAMAASTPTVQVSGPVRLSSAGDVVRLKYTCTAAHEGVMVLIRQATGGRELTAKGFLPLTCSGHTVVEAFSLWRLDPGHPTLKPGPATAEITTAVGQSSTKTTQPVMVMRGNSVSAS